MKKYANYRKILFLDFSPRFVKFSFPSGFPWISLALLFQKSFFQVLQVFAEMVEPYIGFELARTHHCVELQVSCSFTLTDYGFFYNITLTKV